MHGWGLNYLGISDSASPALHLWLLLGESVLTGTSSQDILCHQGQELCYGTGSVVALWTNTKSSKGAGREDLFPPLCMLNKSVTSPKIQANTIPTPLNSCHWAQKGECQRRAGQEHSWQSECTMANCRFHSWVELSKRYPSTPSSEFLSWCSLLPTRPPSKIVYRWKDVATAHTFLQTAQFEKQAFLRLLCEDHHMPRVITTRAEPSMDGKAAPLPEGPQQHFFHRLFLLLLLETWALWKSL